MSASLYFYDLETSGINPKKDRIMQFAGQRTNLELEPINDPDVYYVKMTNDVLPDPGAILVTGITPQQTVQDGISERDFANFFYDKVATPDTTIMGYNTIRFDNEFIRFLMYRNYFDSYEWSYKNNVSVWDILDTVRMTRALRPEGIRWPYSLDGLPNNKLENLTQVNNIDHVGAHDALSDVNATINIAKLIIKKQPKLFWYLFSMRSKQAVQNVVNSGAPFVYTSGRYSAETNKTTAVVKLADHPVYGSSRALVYDLRHDPSNFIKMSIQELTESLKYAKEQNKDLKLPVKALTLNKCPAVAPISVLTAETQKLISLSIKDVDKHYSILNDDKTFISRIIEVFTNIHKLTQEHFLADELLVDEQLYDGFYNDIDKKTMKEVRLKDQNTIADYHPMFNDERLSKMFLLYKARLFPQFLSEQEQSEYEKYRINKLLSGNDKSMMAIYLQNIQKKMQDKSINHKDKTILEDLWLWAESINPSS